MRSDVVGVSEGNKVVEPAVAGPLPLLVLFGFKPSCGL
jgi:hypothetical protein